MPNESERLDRIEERQDKLEERVKKVEEHLGIYEITEIGPEGVPAGGKKYDPTKHN